MWIIGGFSFSVTKSGSDESASAHLPFIVHPPPNPNSKTCPSGPNPKGPVTLFWHSGESNDVCALIVVRGGFGNLETSGIHFHWCRLACVLKPTCALKHPHHFSVQSVL